jgi:TolA-binding protein
MNNSISNELVDIKSKEAQSFITQIASTNKTIQELNQTIHDMDDILRRERANSQRLENENKQLLERCKKLEMELDQQRSMPKTNHVNISLSNASTTTDFAPPCSPIINDDEEIPQTPEPEPTFYVADVPSEPIQPNPLQAQQAAEPQVYEFVIGEKVLCEHQGFLYDAKVRLLARLLTL